MPPAAPQQSPVGLAPLLSFVAISQSNKADEIIEKLLLQCLIFYPSETMRDAGDFVPIFKSLFGLEIPCEKIERALDTLLLTNRLTRPNGTNFVVPPKRREQIEKGVADAEQLESRVRLGWIKFCETDHPTVDSEQGWQCLQDYLFRLFRRHGLQTVALLDCNVVNNEPDATILAASLSEVVKKKCKSGDQSNLESAIGGFLATVGNDADRTKYIVQLADGAFNYCSLSVPPELAIQLQSKLHELTLFLDTNFLFGVFGLDTNPLVAVSQDLVQTISKHALPFKLRYHQATDLEMRRTILAIANSIKRQHWTAALSRAAVTSPFVSGIERHFHEENAKNSVDPELFFKPYEHVDVLLKERGILIYRENDEGLEQRADLIAEYTDFLKSKNREKPYEAIDHDMTILRSVRGQRSKATSSLEAKALIITCDTILQRFDWSSLKRKTGTFSCTVLPNQFLQLLRPYVPASADFDRSFAATFAIPEFRAISGGYHLASSKLLSLLATYKNLKEETASSLLSNTMLLDNLKRVTSEKAARELVESAVLSSNADLLEERIAMKEEIIRRKVEEETQKRMHVKTLAELAAVRAERDQFKEQSQVARQKVTKTETEYLEKEYLSSVSTEKSTQLATNLAGRVEELERQRAASDISAEHLKTGIVIVSALLLCVFFEWFLARFNVTSLLNHPNSYGLRILTYIAVELFAVGSFRPSRRNLLWYSLGSAVLITILSLLGGRSAFAN